MKPSNATQPTPHPSSAQAAAAAAEPTANSDAAPAQRVPADPTEKLWRILRDPVAKQQRMLYELSKVYNTDDLPKDLKKRLKPLDELLDLYANEE